MGVDHFVIRFFRHEAADINRRRNARMAELHCFLDGVDDEPVGAPAKKCGRRERHAMAISVAFHDDAELGAVREPRLQNASVAFERGRGDFAPGRMHVMNKASKRSKTQD